jgi:hypothetical protein
LVGGLGARGFKRFGFEIEDALLFGRHRRRSIGARGLRRWRGGGLTKEVAKESHTLLSTPSLLKISLKRAVFWG